MQILSPKQSPIQIELFISFSESRKRTNIEKGKLH